MNAPVPVPRVADFTCEKKPATGSRGMVVTNHPLASAAGAQILLAGGNAIDAAVASLFALTVAEPMMVGILGGGLSHIRLADGRHVVIDNLSTAPGKATADMYECLSDEIGKQRDTRDRENVVGAKAVAVPGALKGWCEALARFGTLPLAEVLQPAIGLAERGFVVTPYLSNCITDNAADLARDPGLAAMLLPGGQPLQPGMRLIQSDYAASLKLIAAEGPEALYGGKLGRALTDYMAANGGLIDQADLSNYRIELREPIRGSYRGYEIIGPPPPSSSGVHIAQMLNILEGYDIGALGFGSTDAVHLLAEALKIAFADRAVATADPAFVKVPVARLIDKAYADERRALIAMEQAKSWTAGLSGGESADTTHVTVADAMGNVVSATQTINGLFGACVQTPGTGMIANNYMYNFDPHPGRALSIAPGKRVFTSMAPMMAVKEGRLAFALGLPGALRIFPSALQAIVNLIDHRMSLQEAVEAPRVWTEGGVLELEEAIPESVAQALIARGHKVVRSPRVAGGMNAIAFNPDGTLTGAACWRADGTPVAISGGLARAGARFTI
uniref:Acylase ACY 1 proenzyme n=1 Tax=Pseudomonas sp. (strain V22) TaxID=33068 RepID=PAC1_PSESV|nr:RecName: Full=Acylase ACY 1 proenzyme; Includes: RecName: Full=Cephalosporin acylase; AltName: Full=GL-7ACA acylase; Includes: RecName: Full=Gamma-glutamyltranspeptidase; Short=GGT; AltName: Full=Glutathione hydrolase; Contains: RecName: Full=Acylase ACY 1 large subunit; Contains: RecName: Full=Acylase ACY 1 small subunit [Pseudomonas sp. V22]CAA48785.1 cephalosporin acylase [Pseudomonas sp.]